jgi:very-short-patch-repair endonuclease
MFDLVRASAGRPGVRALRAICGESRRLTRSGAERRFLSLLRESHLPLPETNAKLAGHEVDFIWRGARLVVETDGWAAHSSRTAFERDRRRDAELAARGFQVIRVTWRQLATEPAGTLALLARALAARAGPRWPTPS